MARALSPGIVDELRGLASEDQLPALRKRLPPGEQAFGLRMRDLFAVAKAHTSLSLEEVEALLDHPAYEPRMAAFCILDFKARGRLSEEERLSLYATYLRRHDAITAWDMVDRAAPRVVGGYLVGRDLTPLRELADSSRPLERRTAITAPLMFVWGGSEADLAVGFDIARQLAPDAEPVVHNTVGIFLKHAGTRDVDALRTFLDRQASVMPRPALRLAIEKLDSAERKHYLESSRG